VSTIQQFEEGSSVRNRRKSDKPATNKSKALDVLQSFVEDPHIFINRVAQQHEIRVASVHKILKKKINAIHTKLHLYSISPRII